MNAFIENKFKENKKKIKEEQAEAAKIKLQEVNEEKKSKKAGKGEEAPAEEKEEEGSKKTAKSRFDLSPKEINLIKKEYTKENLKNWGIDDFKKMNMEELKKNYICFGYNC